jgi:hypothetical protein
MLRGAIQPVHAGGAGAPSERARLSYVCQALRSLAISVEETAHAWEERGYWTKADGFRREWSWVEPTLGEFEAAEDAANRDLADASIARLLVRLIQLGVEIPKGGDPLASGQEDR